MHKSEKQSIMIHRVNNGFVIGVIKKNEARRMFDTGALCKEIHIASNEKEVSKIIMKILPKLVQVDDVSVEPDEEDD